MPAGLATTHPSLFALVAGFVLAAALTGVLCIVVARICRRLGVLDRPEPRRVHTKAVPRLGGIAIFVSFLTVSLLVFRPANDYELHVYAGLIAAAVLIVAVMAYDDIWGLPPLPRLGVQALAALIAMFPAGHGTLIEVIHNPLIAQSAGHTLLALWVAIPFTMFWIVGMMNTINWVDGLDGLAGGVVTITALVMAAISWLLGQHTAALLCAVLAGATLGFLPLNWHPARLFMGDSGAMFLGLALAVLANVGGAKLATMLLLLGLPILDTARVIVRRLRQGRSPLHFDRSHIHHRLLSGGLSQRQIAALFYIVTATFGGVTILAAYLQTRAGAWMLRIHPLPWLDISVSELPTLLGLALVVAVSVAIWRVATLRRRHMGIPPGASSAIWRRPSSGQLPSAASGSHRRP
ncbi:MAG TPA: MraY family glycosyltransferase [Ktedonobacterales bacterium]|nr:MraY family glycosyltransferase [Ktedonobacterales bacterium]